MTDPVTTPKAAGFKFEIGDKLLIPGHSGSFVGIVVHRYKSLDDACEKYLKSFRTILQSPTGKPKPDQPYYYCEVDNSTHRPLGVAEDAATLKWRPEPEDE